MLTKDPWVQFAFDFDMKFTGIALRIPSENPSSQTNLLMSENDGSNSDCLDSSGALVENPKERERGLVVLAGFERCDSGSNWGDDCKKKTLGCGKQTFSGGRRRNSTVAEEAFVRTNNGTTLSH